MSYMLLIQEPVGQRATRTEAQGQEAYAAMQRFGQAIEAAGQLQAVASLAGLNNAARVHQGQVLDGPFAEAKEMVGGFFLLRDVNRAQALAWAQQCPAAAWATVEVRALAPCFDESVATAS
jgi:hypothetical protein